MKTISFLFNRFPRDVGIPYKGTFYRRPVYSREDFINYINTVNGTSPGCYTSLYESGNDLILDKAVFDFDSLNLDESLEDCKTLSSHFTSDEIQHLILFSGRKGFHLYTLFEPLKLNRETGSHYLTSFHRRYGGGNGSSIVLKTLDTHLFGNSSAMIRIPNTLNHGHYCTYLPLDEFQNWNVNKVLEWSKTPHRVFKPNGQLKTIDKIVSPSQKHFIYTESISLPPLKTIPNDNIISRLIRPCVFKLIHNKEPEHLIRIDFVCEMKFFGYDQSQIFEILKRYNWIDWNPQITQYQINDIFKKNLKPVSCEKLRQLGSNCEKCNWYYFW